MKYTKSGKIPKNGKFIENFNNGTLTTIFHKDGRIEEKIKRNKK